MQEACLWSARGRGQDSQMLGICRREIFTGGKSNGQKVTCKCFLPRPTQPQNFPLFPSFSFSLQMLSTPPFIIPSSLSVLDCVLVSPSLGHTTTPLRRPGGGAAMEVGGPPMENRSRI